MNEKYKGQIKQECASTQLQKQFNCVKCAHIKILMDMLGANKSLHIEQAVELLSNQIIKVFTNDFKYFTNNIDSELMIQFCLRYAYGSIEMPLKYFNCNTFNDDCYQNFDIFITTNTFEGITTYKFEDQIFCKFVLFENFATQKQQNEFITSCTGLTKYKLK
ncbi:Hypothetical_protein [Hexamita inflata]|uniref:Hypothetical_protein n=1 Tax=Hexamita inflata TaxID=28002 RepID=A0AA86P1D9_9EUKA|nr:Hypothetical protein HINF_LOCUS18447 [Hexamita inflata]